LLLLPGLLVLGRILRGDEGSGFDHRRPGVARADDAAMTAKQGDAAMPAKRGDATITAKHGSAAVGASGSSATTAARVAAFCVPALLLIVPWLAWKVFYYGDLLPNTFYVKVTSAASLARGGHYVYRFFATYWLLPLAVLALVARPRRVAAALRRGGPWGAVLPATALLWCAYVAFVGGDFMEFRFMVPALPLVMALLAWCLFAVADDRRARAAVVAVVVLGSAFHAATFWGVRDIESIRSLAIHMEPDGGDWDEVGRTLGEHFGPADGVLIAVGPAGAIPYYSRLPAVDMRGLVDPWVARHGIIVSTVPGHQRMAPLAYLVDRGVNLVVGHPQVIARQRGLPDAYTLSSLGQLSLADASPATVPPGARILAIPMPGDRLLLVLYLVRDPAVDRAIAEKGWPTVPLVDSVEPLG
jgi:arabinofuranosyltransferase